MNDRDKWVHSIKNYNKYMWDKRSHALQPDTYLLVVLQLLVTSCSCYNNNCITKLWAPALTSSIYTLFSWHFSQYFIEHFQCYFRVFHLWYRGKRRQSRKYLLYYFSFEEKQLHCEKYFIVCLLLQRRMTTSWNPLITLCCSPFIWTFI